MRHPGFLLALIGSLVAPAHALDYRSTVDAALLYDAPSTAAARVAFAGKGVPLEIVVDTDLWAKVRDPSGRLAWIEKTALGHASSVMIRSELAEIRQEPRIDAEVTFRAARGVLLELTDEARPFGWLPVRHPDGHRGWLPARDAWGG